MSDKELKSKAIQIKGKDYVQVKDRVLYFNEKYPNGCIRTSLVSWENNIITMISKVVPDVENMERYFTGYSQEIVGEGMINKTSALENAETSAVGRSLALMGIGVIDSIASTDEMNKAFNRAPDAKVQATPKGNCKDCGADMIMSQRGKVYCSKKCWLNETVTPIPVSEPSAVDYANDLPF